MDLPGHRSGLDFVTEGSGDVTVGSPNASDAELVVDEWRRLGIRALPPMSARVRVENAPPPIIEIVDERAAQLAVGRSAVSPPTASCRRAFGRSAVRAWTRNRSATHRWRSCRRSPSEQRQRCSFPMDATEWRMWINVHMNHFRHGLMLEDLAPPVRELALGILRATLSARGFGQARSIMRLNQLLAELTGDHEAFGEWPYFVSIFGEPGGDDPWGWQIDGHHLCVNTVVFDGRIVMTPAFMGAEPRRVQHGRLAGTSLFDPEEALGLDLIRSFDTAQRGRATIYPSIHPDDIPAHLQNLFDGRIEAGAFHDNLVAPYQGVAGSEMTDAQRRLLLALVGTYVGWCADGHAEVKMVEVASHVDETWFSWYGGTGNDSPFYYRVHSPGDPRGVRSPPRCCLRQRGADPPPRSHGGAHPQRRRLRRRPAAPTPRAVRPRPQRNQSRD